jgi:hypothetical protein
MQHRTDFLWALRASHTLDHDQGNDRGLVQDKVVKSNEPNNQSLVGYALDCQESCIVFATLERDRFRFM